jgi:hypothetical protein
MPAHGSTGQVGVVARNGSHDRAVLVNRLLPGGLALKVAAQPRKQRAVALIKKLGVNS